MSVNADTLDVRMCDDTECILCGGALGRVLLAHDEPDRFERHVGITPDRYRRHWLECSACGGATNIHMIEARNRLAAIGADYYDVDFGSEPIEAKFSKIMGLPPGQSDNAARAARVLAKLNAFGVCSKTPLKVLDVGAGTGVFLAKLVELAALEGTKIAATAVEPDPNAARHLRSLRRFDVHEGVFDERSTFPDRQLITLNKVLEHLRNPHDLLRQLAGSLSRIDGVLYVEVPDVMTIGRRPKHDNILGSLHHHLYNLRALERVLARAGFIVMEIARIFEPSGKISVYSFAVLPEHASRLAGR